LTTLRATVVAKSGWEGVHSLLKEDGFDASIFQNPMTALADSVAAIRQIIAQAGGPVVLVGYSYGGVVITEADNDTKISNVVYITAFTPDKGESVVSLFKDPLPAHRAADPAVAGRPPFPPARQKSRRPGPTATFST
jgi:pimeloyl-ACP methyl ester carboxylesterase